MRPIKFRAKSAAVQKLPRLPRPWSYGGIMADGEEVWLCVQTTGKGIVALKADPETVSQFTGMFDKNGNEIYEGDIISIEFTEPVYLDEPTKYHQAFVVEYKNGSFCLVGDRTLLFTDCRLEQQKLEDIGNIYE